MKLGIVGLPNVGKSTLFNSLTKAGAESANYPFCTIDPNVGVVPVPDERLKLLGDLYHSAKSSLQLVQGLGKAVQRDFTHLGTSCSSWFSGYIFLPVTPRVSGKRLPPHET